MNFRLTQNAGNITSPGTITFQEGRYTDLVNMQTVSRRSYFRGFSLSFKQTMAAKGTINDEQEVTGKEAVSILAFVRRHRRKPRKPSENSLARSRLEQRATRIQRQDVHLNMPSGSLSPILRTIRTSFDTTKTPTVETASSQKINQQRLRVTSSCYKHHTDTYVHPVCNLSTALRSPSSYKLHLCASRRVFFSRTDFLSVKSLT